MRGDCGVVLGGLLAPLLRLEFIRHLVTGHEHDDLPSGVHVGDGLHGLAGHGFRLLHGHGRLWANSGQMVILRNEKMVSEKHARTH
jgi:hypothetical protein